MKVLQAFTEAEQAWALMADREAFDTYLRSLDLERLQDVIYRLEVYEDQFSRETCSARKQLSSSISHPCLSVSGEGCSPQRAGSS